MTIATHLADFRTLYVLSLVFNFKPSNRTNCKYACHFIIVVIVVINFCLSRVYSGLNLLKIWRFLA